MSTHYPSLYKTSSELSYSLQMIDDLIDLINDFPDSISLSTNPLQTLRDELERAQEKVDDSLQIEEWSADAGLEQAAQMMRQLLNKILRRKKTFAPLHWDDLTAKEKENAERILQGEKTRFERLKNYLRNLLTRRQKMYDAKLDETEELIADHIEEVSNELSRDIKPIHEMIELSIASVSSAKKMLELATEELNRFQERTSTKMSKLPANIIEAL